MAIAIDVMGGDFAPKIPVRGAVKTVNEEEIDLVLVGDQNAIKKELDLCKFDARKINIVHANQSIDMHESALQALRFKKDSSMRLAYDLHKNGEVEGVVSAGHSGAMLAIGKFVLKTIKGIDRPCISALLPSNKSQVLLLDAGANLDCQPFHLLQFAIMGDVYAKHILHISNPKIRLLNIGEERTKGNELAKDTYELLSQCESINFLGNLEGKAFFNGETDVVVTDGYPGNIFLKSVQGAANFVGDILEEEIEKSILSKLGALLMKPVFKNMKTRINYASYGGAPLLGLRGVGVVCHGSSNVDAIQFAIRFANWASEAKMVSKVEEVIHQNQEHLNKKQING